MVDVIGTRVIGRGPGSGVRGPGKRVPGVGCGVSNSLQVKSIRNPQAVHPPRSAIRSGLLCLCFIALTCSGCLVPQPAGKGEERRVREPRTGAEYFLYLPEAYVKNNGVHPVQPSRRWPLVMTFHGMKPYDTWDRQIHEWQQEADTYGYVVCAPWLQSCDSFMEFPLRKEHGYVLRDKEAVMAVLDHVLATTRADPNAVMSTSWSSGGYMAHYFPNRFPHRFSCIATRLSNFSQYILLDSTVPLYRDTPVAVFIGDADFAVCRRESEMAVAWYRSRGFRTVEAKRIDSIGHRRVPQTAAAFFARHLGIEPLKPEDATKTLARIPMVDWEPSADLLARMAPAPPLVGPLAMGNPTSAKPTPGPSAAPSGAKKTLRPNTAGLAYRPPDAGLGGSSRFGDAVSANQNSSSLLMTDGVGRVSGGPNSTGARHAPKRVQVRLSGPAAGTSPFYVAFRTDLTSEQLKGADFLWTLDGVPLCNTPNGAKILHESGTHHLAVLVITEDGQEHRGSTSITVRRSPSDDAAAHDASREQYP